MNTQDQGLTSNISQLINKFSQSTPDNKLNILNEALNYGEGCKQLFLKALDDKNLLVRFSSYKHLIDAGDGFDAPEAGVRLDPGDRIYIIYKSYIGYTDEDYFVSQDVDLKGERELEQKLTTINDEDWKSEGFENFESYRAVTLYDYGHQPMRKTWHPSLNEATKIANELHIKYVWEHEFLCEECFYEEQQVIVNSLCYQNNIPVEEYKNEWGHTDIEKLGKEFRKAGDIELLANLIEVLYGKLAFVYEELITTPRYLKLDFSPQQ